MSMQLTTIQIKCKCESIDTAIQSQSSNKKGAYRNIQTCRDTYLLTPEKHGSFIIRATNPIVLLILKLQVF